MNSRCKGIRLSTQQQANLSNRKNLPQIKLNYKQLNTSLLNYFLDLEID